MKVNNVFHGGVRRALTTGIATIALMASGIVLGVAGTASAVAPYPLLVITSPAEPVSTASGAVLTVQPVVTVETAAATPDTTVNTGTATASITGGVGGTLAGATSGTFSSGVATFSGLILNGVAGTVYTITITGDSLSTSFIISAAVGAASKLAITTQPDPGALTGVPLLQQPVVKVEDTGGNVITSVNTGTAVASVSSGTAVLSAGATSSTFSSGVATFSGLTLTGTESQTATLIFTGPFVSAASNAITISGVATHIAITTQPSASATNGVVLAQQPVIKVEDALNNVVMFDTSTVVASILAGTPGSTITNGSIAAVAGSANFAGMALNVGAGTYTLAFTDGSFTPVASVSVTVVAGAAAKLVITTAPPATAQSGVALTIPPVVKIEDSGGNTVLTNTSTVIATFTAGGISLLNASVPAVAGVATFTGLTLNALAGPYTLTFSDGALTAAVSSTITIAAGTATKLVIGTQPAATGFTGVALSTQPVVKVEDSGGNVVATDGSTVTATVTSSVNTVTNGTAVAASGVATFTALAVNAPNGPYTLTFTDGTLTSAISSTVTIVTGTAQSALVVTTVAGTYGRPLTLATSGGTGAGAVTFVAANGTATGCTVTGTVLTYASPGTCTVTATKAGDATYAFAVSSATTVTVTKLPIPGALKFGYAGNNTALSNGAKGALTILAGKLTVNSYVTITGYAVGNLNVAKARAIVASHFLLGKIHAHITMHWLKNPPKRLVTVATVSQ